MNFKASELFQNNILLANFLTKYNKFQNEIFEQCRGVKMLIFYKNWILEVEPILVLINQVYVWVTLHLRLCTYFPL